MQRLEFNNRGLEFPLRPHTRNDNCFASGEILPLEGANRCGAHGFKMVRSGARELCDNSLGALVTRRLDDMKQRRHMRGSEQEQGNENVEFMVVCLQEYLYYSQAESYLSLRCRHYDHKERDNEEKEYGNPSGIGEIGKISKSNLHSRWSGS
ncbi:hypothetical protein D5086_017395 [Populus alba]|uniref:Uncharacterized protein n=1 Tax=Populus alba TaxID=43335 RepID=A0ACC4BWK9_POPAL